MAGSVKKKGGQSGIQSADFSGITSDTGIVLKISQEVARQIMNHSPEGLDNVYNKHDYLDEMAEAMLKYSTFLISCIKG